MIIVALTFLVVGFLLGIAAHAWLLISLDARRLRRRPQRLNLAKQDRIVVQLDGWRRK